MVLDRAHAHHVQVLPRGTGVAVPAVVREVHQDVGATEGELANFVAKDGFVTDERPKSMVAGVEQRARVSGREVPCIGQQAAREKEDALEGDVLAERHQVHLGVVAGQAAVRLDESG